MKNENSSAGILEPKITAIAPWFGGKRTLAPRIVEQLGEHLQYFEPFCGSMAVLFAKKPSRHETVNDLHGDLINLARCLQQEEAFRACRVAIEKANHFRDAKEMVESK